MEKKLQDFLILIANECTYLIKSLPNPVEIRFRFTTSRQLSNLSTPSCGTNGTTTDREAG